MRSLLFFLENDEGTLPAEFFIQKERRKQRRQIRQCKDKLKFLFNKFQKEDA